MCYSYLKSACIVLCLALFLTSCSKDEQADVGPSSNFEDISFSYSTFELDILKEVNTVRIENGLNELDIINLISAEAFGHNNHMLSMDEVCHHNVQERKQSLKSQLNAIGVGENIAHGNATAKSIVEAWMESEGHRANILHESYTHFGISAVEEDTDTFYFTNIFVIK